mmetsp:Transcript_17441/g.37326  ORF Transcript_17441/g.37326 Transcript_17441/m.37326 type:complete len:200 (+) Transcript_17441:398-997(+)
MGSLLSERRSRLQAAVWSLEQDLQRAAILMIKCIAKHRIGVCCLPGQIAKAARYSSIRMRCLKLQESGPPIHQLWEFLSQAPHLTLHQYHQCQRQRYRHHPRSLHHQALPQRYGPRTKIHQQLLHPERLGKTCCPPLGLPATLRGIVSLALSTTPRVASAGGTALSAISAQRAKRNVVPGISGRSGRSAVRGRRRRRPL